MMEYPIEYARNDGGNNESLINIISHNFNSIVNIIENYCMYDVHVIDAAIETSHILINMCKTCSGEINLYSLNNKRVESLRQMNISVNQVVEEKHTLFPTLKGWQLEEIIYQLIPVLSFLRSVMTCIMDDFNVNNLFAVHKITCVSELNDSLYYYLKNKFNFGENVLVDISLFVDNSDKLENLMLKQKIRKYLDKNAREYLKEYITKNIMFELNFSFTCFGINIKQIKNF
ncbi:26.9-kDa protein [Tetterwort vein chlorosis virus]|uniref:26.9-kDa protein n=1 Tax=Tetterwort vein chlorosis virus TaxID=1712389 RepID=A0A0M4MYJ3_9CLOS|nr:26.9-kDa protein [Tetterwort vein chlorosis virus]ALE18225.1 26.9-kDa protein [Tetterwort vein chlorosis virus]